MRKKLKLGILSFALLTAIFTGCSKDDTTSPLIALTGSDETYSLPSVAGGNAAWVEPGYTATDEEDGTITAKVSVSGTVDLNTKGIYTITYSVSDEAGNSASATRTVRVVNDVEMFAGSWIDCYDSSYNFGTVSLNICAWQLQVATARDQSFLLEKLFEQTSLTTSNQQCF